MFEAEGYRVVPACDPKSQAARLRTGIHLRYRCALDDDEDETDFSGLKLAAYFQKHIHRSRECDNRSTGKRLYDLISKSLN